MPAHLPHYLLKRRQPRPLRKERGIAMITALMIVAIAVTVVASIFVQQRYSIRLTRNFQDLEQTYQYAYAAEDLAGVLLKRDFEINKHDSAFDNWDSKNIEPFEIDDDNGEQIGLMQIEIEDMQSRFNINNLVKKPPPTQTQGTGQNQATTQTGTQIIGQAQRANPTGPPDKPREAVVRAFQVLLQQTDLPTSFSHAVIDWIDADDQPFQTGAESDYYLKLEQPYEAGNAFLVDPGEMTRIKMDGVKNSKEQAEKLKSLLPYVAALPTPTSINVNTASKEVLLSTSMLPRQADMIINLRQSQPITDMNLLNQLTGNTLGLDAKTASLLGFESNYFRLAGEVRLGKSRLFLNSLLFRSPQGEVRVIMRQFSRVPKPKPKKPTFSG